MTGKCALAPRPKDPGHWAARMDADDGALLRSCGNEGTS